MDEHRDRVEDEFQEEPARPRRWPIFVAVIALAIAGIALGFGYSQQANVTRLTGRATEMNSTISQLQSQLDTTTSKLNEIAAAQAAAVAKAQEEAQKAATAKATTARRRTPAEDKRFKQMQAQLEDQKKQLKDTQDAIAQARSDLEGNLSSTRDELNGSIARTHEELVELQRRGERNYFEFDLTKAKTFQRSGPIMLSLRKADAKHKRYDLAMIVDDNQLSKKSVNLYEPIWIHSEDIPQPLQVVVNRVDKNHVHGYVSAPKYKSSELRAGGAAAPGSPNAGQPPNQKPPENQPDPNRPPQ